MGAVPAFCGWGSVDCTEKSTCNKITTVSIVVQQLSHAHRRGRPEADRCRSKSVFQRTLDITSQSRSKGGSFDISPITTALKFACTQSLRRLGENFPGRKTVIAVHDRRPTESVLLILLLLYCCTCLHLGANSSKHAGTEYYFAFHDTPVAPSAFTAQTSRTRSKGRRCFARPKKNQNKKNSVLEPILVFIVH